ncbi:hypothetical protein IL306_011701 [Fusarium sp. DS 682]|nr:hypothetical protein IL306_011701 [Fusarium sp. DS 682]
MADSQPKPIDPKQTASVEVEGGESHRAPDLEDADYNLSDEDMFREDATFQEDETQETGEVINDNDDPMVSDGIPPLDTPAENTGPAEATESTNTTNPTTQPSVEQSLENLTALVKFCLEMTLNQNIQNGMVLTEILRALLHEMPDTVLDTRGKIRVQLNEEDYEKVKNDLQCQGVIDKFQEAGAPWNMVTDMRLVGNKVMILTVANEEWEDAIQLQPENLSRILGLDTNSRVMKKRYTVEVPGYHVRSDETPRSQKERWSLWNGIAIDDAFTSSNILILAMSEREDAEKLWKSGGMLLKGKRLPVCPIDLRALDVWCRNCQQPSHLRHECTQPTRCGRCAGNHATNVCERVGYFRCVNCPEVHRSQSRHCKNSKVQEMLEECAKWRKAGPWARAVRQPQLPDQALMSQLRSYRNSPAGQAFLNRYMTVPEPSGVAGNQGSTEANTASAAKAAPKAAAANNNKRKRGDVRDLMSVSQESQRALDQQKKAALSAKRGPGRPRLDGSGNSTAPKKQRS